MQDELRSYIQYSLGTHLYRNSNYEKIVGIYEKKVWLFSQILFKKLYKSIAYTYDIWRGLVVLLKLCSLIITQKLTVHGGPLSSDSAYVVYSHQSGGTCITSEHWVAYPFNSACNYRDMCHVSFVENAVSFFKNYI